MALGGGRIAGGTFATRTMNSQATSTKSESSMGSAMVARCPAARRRRRGCGCEYAAFSDTAATAPTLIAASANGVGMAELSRRRDLFTQVPAHRVEVGGFRQREIARARKRNAHVVDQRG